MPKLALTLELSPVIRLEDDSVCARWTIPVDCIASCNGILVQGLGALRIRLTAVCDACL